MFAFDWSLKEINALKHSPCKIIRLFYKYDRK